MTNKETVFNDIVSMREAMEQTGLSKVDLYNKIEQGVIATSIINKKIYFLRTDLLAWTKKGGHVK